MNQVEQTEPLEFNPRLPQLWVDPYPTYHDLRGRDPIHYRRSRGDWVLTRYADIVSVLGDSHFGYPPVVKRADSGPNWRQLTRLPQSGSKLLRLRQKAQEFQDLWVTLRHPPDHTRLRTVVSQPFTHQIVVGLHQRIQTITDSLIDRLQGVGVMDIMADLAYPLSAQVMSHILGLPIEDLEQFRRWSRDLAYIEDMPPSRLNRERALMATISLAEYFQKLIAECEKRSKNGLINTLTQAQRQGKLSDDELLAQCIFLSFGTHWTTQQLIGNAVLALLRHPDQLRLLREDQGLIQTAIEEALRYDSPVQTLVRIALAGVKMGDKTIEKGQRVWLLLGAANRDPDQFPEPDRFDISRSPNHHLAFGQGIHYCLGAKIARMEAQIAIGTLVHRLPQLALGATPIDWEDNFNHHGLKALPVVF